MNNQLIKDFGRLLNDTRLGLCDVRNAQGRIVGYGDLGSNDEVIIGSIVFSYGNGTHKVIARDLYLSYDNIIDSVRAVYSDHPTRDIDDVLYSCRYDTGLNTLTLDVTNSSNLELYNVKHKRISAALRSVIESTLDKDHIEYVTQYCDKFISNFDKRGGFSFKLT